MILEFMYNLEKLYPKSFKKLAGWTLKSNLGFDTTPISELKYDYSQYSDGWAFYWKNGNGRNLDILRLFDFFEYMKIEVTLKEYKERRFEDLFKRLESVIVEEDTSVRDAEYVQLQKHKGHVYKNIEKGFKVCISDLKDVAEIVGNSNFEKVADRPHGDGDFSYLCSFEHCRCSN